MKPKTKLFLSLIWRDIAQPFAGLCQFYRIVVPRFLLIIASWVVFLDFIVMAWDGASWKIDLSTWAYAYIALYAIYGLYKWLKLRWDQLPDKVP